MKIPAFLFVAFLAISSCSYKSVSLYSRKESDTLNIEGILANLQPGKEYSFKLNRQLPFKYGEMVYNEWSIRMIYVSSTNTLIRGKRIWFTSRPRKRIEQLDSIPMAAVTSIEREKVEVVRTAALVVLLPIFIVGVVFMFYVTGGRGI